MVSKRHLKFYLGALFFAGIGLGLTLCIPAVYIVEISSANHRGVLGVLPNLFCQLGIFATYVTGHWLEWNTLAFAST